MRKLRKLIREKKGTTMAEMLVTLLLITIMTGMAASSLAAASRIFIRVQKTQYAQSILDTVMTELRTITKNAGSYVKIYENGKNIVDATGNSSGNAIEFINEEGYVVLLSTDGAKATTLYLGENQIGTAGAVPEGQLLTRYYTRNSSTQTYLYQRENAPAARAVAAGYGKGFYDRYLSRHTQHVTVAMALDFQVVEQVPADAHDICPQILVTPTAIYGK